MNAKAEGVAVSVILPTMALAGRRALIRRAIDSVLDQTGVRAIPTVIVNGPARDPDLTRELIADDRLRVHVLEKAGLANALQVGRRLIDTPWFAELDDDDLLLPGALASRVDALVESQEHDCVVTNGYRRSHDEDILNIADMGAVGRDPIRTFWDRNWLLPGSYLCRTDRVGLDLFDGMPECLECTYLALRLAISYRVKFLQLPTVIWDQRTPDSLSKSREFALSQSAAHERLLELDLPPYARQKVLERIALNFHSISGLHLREGDRLKAWYSHLQSLVRRGGYRYLPYTRRLLFAMVAPRRETR